MIIHGDCLEQMKMLAENSVDSIVTDPPYGLSFMGKKWDYDVPSVEVWREALRVLKPGGHLLSFGGTRTYHRMVVAIEDAGFEIRDQIMWLYGSGFPKSLDISKAIDKAAGAEPVVVGKNPNWRPAKTKGGAGFDKDVGDGPTEMNLTEPSTDLAKQWSGWGTALKPANEPIVLARKPLIGTVAKNVEKFGTGGLNIDESRIEAGDLGELQKNWNRDQSDAAKGNVAGGMGLKAIDLSDRAPTGRWPANIILDEEAARLLDEQSGDIRSRHGHKEQGYTNGGTGSSWMFKDEKKGTGKKVVDTSQNGYLGGASRFFQVIKQDEYDKVAQCYVDALNAASTKSKNHALDFAPDSAQENTPLDFGNKNRSASIAAPIAASVSKTTKATSKARKSSARVSATPNIDSESQSPIAQSAASFATSIVTAIARNPVAMQPDQIQGLIQCLASTPDFKNCIQTQNLASLAASKADTDIIEIIQSLLRLSGSVRPAIDANINSENPSDKFAPTRFLYQAKASKRERNAGLEGIVKEKQGARPNSKDMSGKFPDHDHRPSGGNNHPTVKPIKLMQYLIRLVTPKGGIVLDPFMGSGTTGCAAVSLGFDFIGIEMNAEYFEIAKRRIEHESEAA